VTELTDAPADEPTLEEYLSRPLPGVAGALAAAGGDIVLLGAGGKIGPSMARMARRALADTGSDAQVIAVSRFSDAGSRPTSPTRPRTPVSRTRRRCTSSRR
jgi:hypothetical protein